MRSRFNTVVVFTIPPTRHYISQTRTANINDMHDNDNGNDSDNDNGDGDDDNDHWASELSSEVYDRCFGAP